MEKIAKRILEIRKLENENQIELANAIGVAQSAISQWEKGINEPKASYIVKICQHYSISADYLLGLTDLN